MIWLTRFVMVISIAANVHGFMTNSGVLRFIPLLAVVVLTSAWVLLERLALRRRRVDETTKLTLQQLPHLFEPVVWLTLHTAPLRDINEIRHYLRTHKVAQVPTDDMPELIVTFLLLVAYRP